MDDIITVPEAFFARQPIFDRAGSAHAYELLYRRSPKAVAADGDPAQMAAQVTVDAFLASSIAAVTDGLPAYLNVTRDLLLGGVLEALDPSTLVIEIVETVDADAEVIEACTRLVRLGHTIALDDWFENDPRVPLVPLASIVKIDVLERAVSAAALLAQPFRERRMRIVAERVETQEMHRACVDVGFDLFQGYFYRKPEIVAQPDLRPEQLTIIQAMNLVQDDAVPDHALGQYFKRDPALAYKLVRMANAAPLGVRRIESVEYAVSIVGRAAMFRWLSLLLATSFHRATGIKRELLREALVRARHCELLGRPAGIHQTGHLFLVGLFSRIDALLGVPLPAIIDRVVLPEPVTAALRHEDGPYTPLLSVSQAYADCHWERVPELAGFAGLAADAIPVSYREALDWAAEVHRTI